MKEPRAIYVHVPFCEQICHYCDFNKFFLKNQPVDDYIQLCEEEMINTLNKYPASVISSIYIGGGTPTSLSTSQLEKLLTSIAKHFTLDKNYEWTVEANPGSVNEEKLKMMKDMGVNRLSIGAQTFQDELLQQIGRDHVSEQIKETIYKARNVGFANISIDLMFGLPNQTMEQWVDTLENAVALPISHISAYSLKIEPRTVFYQLWQKGKLNLVNEDVEAEMYEVMCKLLKEYHFHHYEISNFAKDGHESIHNKTYWKNESYYGFGAGAHSYLGGVRRENYGPLPKYMDGIKKRGTAYREEHSVTKKEQMEEEMFMGLRLLDGVSYEKFYEKFHENIHDVFPGVISHLVEQGLLIDDGSNIKLSEKGLLLGNIVFEQFLLTE